MHAFRAAPPGLETKFRAFDAEPAGVDGVLEGYASVFGAADDSGDVVAPGAFSGALARRGRSIKLLWQHDPAQPIGVWESLVEDERGLRGRGRLLTEIRAGAEALALLRAGAVDGLSIGYRALRSEKRADGGRSLLEIDLFEVSLVTFPMLSLARAVASGPAREDDAAEGFAAALSEARGLFR